MTSQRKLVNFLTFALWKSSGSSPARYFLLITSAWLSQVHFDVLFATDDMVHHSLKCLHASIFILLGASSRKGWDIFYLYLRKDDVQRQSTQDAMRTIVILYFVQRILVSTSYGKGSFHLGSPLTHCYLRQLGAQQVESSSPLCIVLPPCNFKHCGVFPAHYDLGLITGRGVSQRAVRRCWSGHRSRACRGFSQPARVHFKAGNPSGQIRKSINVDSVCSCSPGLPLSSELTYQGEKESSF